MKTNLELNFTNELGRNKKISIRKPVLGLTAAEVVPVMETIVASDIFDDGGHNPYAAVKNARYVTTEVEAIYEA